MEKYLVVGKKAGYRFFELDRIISVEDLNSTNERFSHSKLTAGQYLTNDEIKTLSKFCYENQLDFDFNDGNYPVTDGKLVHKLRNENSLITLPKQLSESLFCADVWIDGENEFLQDHVTGYHIQGMVLIEVVRQMFIAVSEEYYFRDWKENSYVVIHELNTKFHQFTFPQSFSVHQENVKIKEKEKSIFFDSNFFITQNNNKTFSANAIYSIYESSILTEKEKNKAQESVKYPFK